MNKIVVVVLGVLSLFGLIPSTQASQCPSTNVVTDPVLFNWTHHPVSASNPQEYYSGTLEMGMITLNIGGGTLTTRAYRQEGSNYSIPGPTIIMRPGKKYVLRFKNTLPYEPLSMMHNDFKDPNVTNVHTHGLHISGETPADDVTRFFEGGFGGDYVYEIPADHMGGTYWYHAHHHGSTFLQVSSGAFGLMLIDDSQDGIPAHVANMQEKHIVLGFLDPTVAGTGGDTLVSGTIGPSWTTNGMINGNICMPPNTWQHWRVLLADRDARIMDLQVGSQCEVKLLGRDGVWRTQVPGAVASNTLTLTGASRADLAIRCSGDSSLTLGGTQVGQIFVDGVSDASVHPFAADGVSTWASKRPGYLRDLRGKAVSGTESINMGARTVLGRQYDEMVPNLIKQADGIQEWNLKGATNHPFHLHVYHVQVQSNCGPYEAGEYYDVIAGNCAVRFDLNPATSTVYAGRTIMHCHILHHEDMGAMGWMQVIGGMAPPSFPANSDIGTPYSAYYSVSGTGGNSLPPAAPSGLTATAASSSRIDLSWSDNASDENGFDIERSLDGISFGMLASVGANVTSFSDSNLAASTPYYYRVSARNMNGSSAWSNTVAATTQASSPAGTTVNVGSITVTTASGGKGLKIGRAIVTVIDELGNPVAGATVSGVFSGDINQSVTGAVPTNTSGSTTIDSTQTAKIVKSLTFCVTSITHDTLQGFTAPIGTACRGL